MTDGSASAHLLRPKLLTTLYEGYDFERFGRDLFAGATVAIVALPLSMAIAIASGVPPERGLYTAIVGGFLVSALGGSRFQIGGPAGAFIVLVATTVAQLGEGGLFAAVFLSGVMLALLGLLRLGTLVRHIPHAVTVGFTCAIAVTIAASQLKDLCGLHLPGAEPGLLLPKLKALFDAAATVNLYACLLGVGAIVIILGLRKIDIALPGMLIATMAGAIVAAMAHMPVETIAHRFGALPRGLPAPFMPDLTSDFARVFPAALSFTLLGAVESLLSAKVADSMSGRRHRSNMELIAQGIANVAASCFGGICVTGTIARTATNVRAGAKTPLAGMLHSAILLGVLVVAAPLAGYVPLPTLAGVLIAVSWTMVEKAELFRLARAWPSALVLGATFAVTILHDLTFGIIAGCVAAALLALLHQRVAEEGE